MDDADLLVIAGGSARRLGGVDKAMIRRPDGRTVLAALLAAPVTGRRVVVGPRRSEVDGVDVWTREVPPGGGPVAAIAAGLAHVGAPVVVLLAGDLPYGADAVGQLLAALPGHDAAVVERDGRAQWLLAAWSRPALAAAIARLAEPTGARVRDLYAGVTLAVVEDGDGDGAQWSGDLDSLADVRRLRDRSDRPGADDGVARRGL